MRTNFCSGFSFALIGWFSPVYIHGRLSDEFSESQAAVGLTFRVAGNYRKAGKAPWILDTGRIFTISKYFIEVCRNFILDFLNKKTAKNGENHQRAFKGSEFAGIRPCNFISSARSSIVLIFLTFNKLLISWNYGIPLNAHSCFSYMLYFEFFWSLQLRQTIT